eukprot:3177424-Pleurochrysis_carterae.AAC.1
MAFLPFMRSLSSSMEKASRHTWSKSSHHLRELAGLVHANDVGQVRGQGVQEGRGQQVIVTSVVCRPKYWFSTLATLPLPGGAGSRTMTGFPSSRNTS